ncbi:MAG: glycosyltransferase family 1 protein [Pleurocapsa sp.]
MTVKVAYDITILGKYFNSPDPKTGIYRFTEELMFAMLQHNQIDFSAVGICGDNLILSSSSCGKYAKKRSDLQFFDGCPDRTSFNLLSKLYQQLASIYSNPDFQKIPKLHPQSVLVRGIFKIINYSYANKIKIYDNFASQKFDVFHSPYYRLPSLCITQNTPRIITIHDLIPVTAREFVDRNMTAYFESILNSIDYNRDWVTCVSEYTRQQFCEYTGMEQDRTFVTHLAADSCFFPVKDKSIIKQVKQKYRIPDSPYFVCLASQLEPRKNIPHLIQCFAKLISQQNNLNDINLVLIGSQRFYQNKLAKVAKILQRYQERIIFTGYVEDEDLNALYSGATAFIFPSLQEGFGLPILEAMQCNVPVIASNVTSLPEVAGDAAILVDPQDKDELCQAMLTILNNESLRQELITKGSTRAKSFSWSKCAKQTIEIYQTAASNL